MLGVSEKTIRIEGGVQGLWEQNFGFQGWVIFGFWAVGIGEKPFIPKY